MKNKKLWTNLSWIGVGLLMLILIISSAVLGWLIYYRERALPGLMVLGQDIGGYSRNEVQNTIDNKVQEQNGYLNLKYEDKSWRINWNEINYKIDSLKIANQSINWGKEWPSILQVLSLSGSKQELPLIYAVDHELLDSKIQAIIDEVNSPAIEAEVQISDEGIISVKQGTRGQMVDKDELKNKIGFSLSWMKNEEIALPVTIVDLRLGDSELSEIEQRALALMSKSVNLKYESGEITWSGPQLASLVGKERGFAMSKLENSIELLSQSVDRPARDAVFEFDNQSGRVREFRAEQNGLTIDKNGLKQNLMTTLSSLETQATDSAMLELPLVSSAPKIKAQDINDLGIKELIGMGESHFKGSISSRLHNIGLAASRISGIVVPPGEEFSFVKNIGEISSATGYEPAYIIMNGQTILGDGGGVCQVSTTVFRAALNSGLMISQRHAHSYRVAYYEQQSFPGLDATIYPPSVDLKFINDTPGHILIQSTFDEKNTYMKVEIFGTSDGRLVEMSKPRLWDVISPAEDLYIDDPNLPVGQVKQTEKRINGAKAAFDWKVTRDGQVLHEKTFTSVFRPWQAVYLRGTRQ